MSEFYILVLVLVAEVLILLLVLVLGYPTYWRTWMGTKTFEDQDGENDNVLGKTAIFTHVNNSEILFLL